MTHTSPDSLSKIINSTCPVQELTRYNLVKTGRATPQIFEMKCTVDKMN